MINHLKGLRFSHSTGQVTVVGFYLARYILYWISYQVTQGYEITRPIAENQKCVFLWNGCIVTPVTVGSSWVISPSYIILFQKNDRRTSHQMREPVNQLFWLITFDRLRHYHFTPLRVFHTRVSWWPSNGVFRDRKSLQVSWTLLSILADLNTTVVWIISTRSLTSKSSSPFISPQVTVKSGSTTTGIIVSLMFHIFSVL